MSRIAIILGLVGAILTVAGGFSHTMNLVGGGGIFLMLFFILWLIGKK
jgi:hypothetical protein